jgi:methionyl-tRNA synthetase
MNSTEKRRYTVTAALPYVNGPKHIGHLAGAYLPADVYVRLKRLQNEDVVFICGSDEHGTPITIQAMKENCTPKEVIDKYHTLVKDCFSQLGISFDIYHRTSEPIHHETAQSFFLDFYNKGLFEERETEQYFDEKANLFLADRYINGTCPNCGHDSAFGDQCEKCGKSLDPTDLINPVSTITGDKPILRKTKHWYLPLQKYEPWLRQWLLRDHAKDWKANVYGQSKSWIDGGLHPRAMTRDGEWGIKVPLVDAVGKVLYVWFDAPIGYISATKQWALDTGNSWEPYWKDKNTKLIHFVGKDNIVFHCIIFPIMLHMHGDFIVPDNVPANEFLNLEGDKMSTSRGWSVEMHDYIADFAEKPDVLRYCLLSNLPENKDSEFTWKDFQTKNNSELVAILGNFINRVTVLTHKYFDGKVPNDKPCDELQAFLQNQKEKIADAIDNYHFREALLEMMNVARHGNKLLTEKEPWKLFKTDPKATAIVLYDCLQIIANLSVFCEPFLPFTAVKIRKAININQPFTWADAGRADLLQPDLLIHPPFHLFEKIEDDIIERQLEKLHKTRLKQTSPLSMENEKKEDSKAEITFDDFGKLELRIGTILGAEKVEKADKLLKLEVDLGFEKRTIVSGIAEHFDSQTLAGKQVMVVVNLAPRKIRGIESKGMILLAEKENGSLEFATVLNEVQNGSIVR